MFLEIITPEKILFEGEVTSVKLPGKTGEFELLNNHAGIVSSLIPGNIRVITTEKNTKNFSTNGGVIEMQNNKIIILLS
ncbi:MAG: ATP synthase F1 subunit epsilon [Bacteroidota bacterium]|nr:ATP synthase F1 subunit epsilon [Bacteroidota bacterium]